MQSTTEEVLQFYRNIVSKPQLLANGYEIIKQFLFVSQKNRGNTLLCILNNQVPILQLIINIYPNEVFSNPIISVQQKRQTVSFILNLITSEIIKAQSIRKQKSIILLMQFLYKIHNISGYVDYVNLYEKSLQTLIQNKSKHLGFFLLNILKDADDRVHELTRFLLKLVISDNNLIQVQQKLAIVYYCLKSMAFLCQTDPDTMQNFVNPYIEESIKFVCQNMNKNVNTIKFSMKILTVLYGQYQVECNKEILQKLQITAKQLISQYLKFLNKNSQSSGQDLTPDDQDEDLPIEVAIYQTLQLFMTLHETKNQTSFQLVIYLCIVSTYINQIQYRAYISNSDQYFIQIQDEGEMNSRNKSINFLQMLLDQNSKKKYVVNCIKMMKEYVNIILNLNSDRNYLNKFLEKYHLPSIILNLNQIYIESTLFMIHSLSDLLIQNQKQMCKLLGMILMKAHPKSIDSILALMILNPLVKRQDPKDQQQFVLFVNTLLYKSSQNIGMQLSLMRSIYMCYPTQQLVVNSKTSNNVPLFFIQQLFVYILKNDSYQNETGYLIIDFIVHLFKNEQNQTYLPSLINYQIQSQLFKKYIHDGMTATALIKLLSFLKNQQIIKQICSLLISGQVKDKIISNLVVSGLKNRIIILSEKDIMNLFQIYEKSVDIIEDIVAAFLQNNRVEDQSLLSLLNKNANPKWIHFLIKNNQMMNLQQNFVIEVKKIIFQITSLYDLQNQLLLPYILLINNFKQAVKILVQNQLFQSFFDKIYNYGKLFKGSNLKMITLMIFVELASMNKALIPKILDLNDSYGSLQDNQWQEQMDAQNQDGVFQKILQNIENSEVEELFQKVFGQLCFSNQQIQAKIEYLKAQI